jgi:hypothetical protein
MYVSENLQPFSSENANLTKNTGLFCYFHILVIITSKKKKYCHTHIIIQITVPYSIIYNWKLGDGLVVAHFKHFQIS